MLCHPALAKVIKPRDIKQVYQVRQYKPGCLVLALFPSLPHLISCSLVCVTTNPILQVRNIRHIVNEQRRISQDALYNLHEIAYDLPEFVWVIQTYPDLICVCGMKKVLDQLDRLLLINSPLTQLLSYDTTFQLGDFYVSPLLFQQILFKESPVVPALFLIHERKFQIGNEQLFEIAASKFSALTRKSFPVVTDEEKGIANAIKKHLPKATRLRCWNHIFQGARY